MPGKLKVRIIAARDLPIMDRSSDLTDAFAEVKFGSITVKTDVCKKSLNPQWNSEWYKFEVEDEELQDEPLQIRVLDHDTYTANDSIGKVYVDLNPLLWKDGVTGISGWIPIYDTMHGIRGEININVKIELFSDINRFRQSSCGVKFFSTAAVPSGYHTAAIHGFVEELVVDEDPEYEWMDKIRKSRTSNEVRQRLFSKLTGELQRKIGLKVLEMAGNAVIGYRQCFDLEGESGIVVRAIGTSVMLYQPLSASSPLSCSPLRDLKDSSPGGEEDGFTVSSPPATQLSSSPAKGSVPCTNRRSSDSEVNNTTPRGSHSSSGGSREALVKLHTKPLVPQKSIEMLEYPFLTMDTFQPGFIVHLGGMVTARSVKLLDRIHNPDEPETRDAWWAEIRTEIRSHAVAMGCHAVIGYRENTSICEEICILSATGTAAIINLGPSHNESLTVLTTSLDRREFEREKQLHLLQQQQQLQEEHNIVGEEVEGGVREVQLKCSLCHVPYSDTSLPFPVNMVKCSLCRHGKVPDVLFVTTELPRELQVTGQGCMIQARLCRNKKKAQGESNAALISDALPFMEYELHRQLMSKLKVMGMNAIFGLRIQVTVGETLLVTVATGTAIYLAGLPPPPILKLASNKLSTEEESKEVKNMQMTILETLAKNKELYGLHGRESGDGVGGGPGPASSQHHGPLHPTMFGEDHLNKLTPTNLGNALKEAYVLEVDDIRDEAVSMLLEPELPKGFFTSNLQCLPGNLSLSKPLQLLNVVRRHTIEDLTSKQLSSLFHNILRSICFKLRKLRPCCLCSIHFETRLPDDEQIQIWATAAVVGTAQEKPLVSPHRSRQASGDTELMFAMEEVTEGSTSRGAKAKIDNNALDKQNQQLDGGGVGGGGGYRPTVEITSLAYIPSAVIDRYLGNINIYFIRESTSVREDGGVSGFMHSFVTEVHALLRAHVLSLGGNALVSYSMLECMLQDSPHKNQCQCLINVQGDAVHVLHDSDIPHFHPISVKIFQESLESSYQSHSSQNSPREFQNLGANLTTKLRITDL